MTNLLKKIHWFIILYALFNVGMSYHEFNETSNQKMTAIENIRSELSKNDKTRREIKKFLDNISDEKQKIEKVAQEIEKTQQLLPADISDSENINLLRRMAEDVNIKSLSIFPENIDDIRGFLIARKYKFKAKATFLQLLIMFEKISESKRILNITDLVIKKNDLGQRSKFQQVDGEFTMEAYKYNPNYKEDRGFDKIENSVKKKVLTKGSKS